MSYAKNLIHVAVTAPKSSLTHVSRPIGICDLPLCYSYLISSYFLLLIWIAPHNVLRVHGFDLQASIKMDATAIPFGARRPAK